MTESGVFSLIIPYRPEMEKEAPARKPYAAVFRNNGKTLVFIATRHSFGRDTPVARLVAGAMGEFSPGTLVLEAHHGRVTRAKEAGIPSEIDFAAASALARGMRIFGGEPSGDELAMAVGNAGFSPQDFLFFHFARSLAGSVAANGRLPWKKTARTFRNYMKNKIPEGKRPPFSAFREWFHTHVGRATSMELAQSDAYAPIADGSHAQRISAAEGGLRDASAVRNIMDALEQSDCVMAVYGASHFLTQRKALEALMGAPEFIMAGETAPAASAASKPPRV